MPIEHKQYHYQQIPTSKKEVDGREDGLNTLECCMYKAGYTNKSGSSYMTVVVSEHNEVPKNSGRASKACDLPTFPKTWRGGRATTVHMGMSSLGIPYNGEDTTPSEREPW